jgi:hypothetical protein
MAEPMYEILGPCGGDQWSQGFERRADQWTQCASLSAHFLRHPGAHESNQPWSNRWEIAPAQRQWAEWVEQPAWHVPDHPGHRYRGHRRAVETAGVAEGGAVTRLSGLDQENAVSVALKPARRADADHASADHSYSFCVTRRHRRANLKRAEEMLFIPRRLLAYNEQRCVNASR